MTNFSRTTKLANKNCRWQSVVAMTLFTLVLTSPNFVRAAGWEIDPIRIELSPQQQTAALTVKNNSDQATSIQIQAVEWAQQGGKDIYKPTKELLVSPPIFSIAPKSEQIIRVALRREADPAKELAYRISLQELPQATQNFMGVKVALRVSLPVFVQSAKSLAEPKMAWEVSQLPDNQLKVVLRNTGNAHIQISDFALFVPGNDTPVAGESGSSYVLAGQTHEWILQTTSMEKMSGNRLRFTAYTDAVNIDTEIVLHKP